jgi:hypothetical protein
VEALLTAQQDAELAAQQDAEYVDATNSGEFVVVDSKMDEYVKRNFARYDHDSDTVDSPTTSVEKPAGSQLQKPQEKQK